MCIFQTPCGLLDMDVDYVEDLFNDSLKIVQRNYFGQYLVEIFENRVPRRLPPVDISNNATPIMATPSMTMPIIATPSMTTPIIAMPSKSTSASSSKPKPRPTRFILDDEYLNLITCQNKFRY